MPRMARLVVPGYPHHVTQRGNRRQPVFFGDQDYAVYLSMMREFCTRFDTRILAYCLMPNHVHFVMVPSGLDGLRAPVAEVHRRYTRRINMREGWTGHLWQERFHSVVMDDEHLQVAVPYVETNPVRAGLCRTPQQWPWSSAGSGAVGEADPLVDWSLRTAMGVNGVPGAVALPTRKVVALRRHTQTGRPIGGRGFVERLEAETGRRLR